MPSHQVMGPADARRAGLRGALAALVLALTPCWVHAQAAPPLKIGLIGPITGPSSDFGVPMTNGVKLAVDEINAVGGYLGRPLQLVVKDDKGDPDTGRKAAEALAKEGVVATIGFCNTGAAQNAIDVFQNSKIPLIIPCATGTPLTTKYPSSQSYIFRTSARDALQAPFVVEDALKRGWDKVAIFADTTGDGEAGYKDVLAALKARKLKPVYVARFKLGVQDLREELKAARDAGANVIIPYTDGPENAVIAQGRKELNWKVPLIGPWTLSFPFFIDGAKDAAEGALMVQTFIAEPSNDRRASFLSAYARKFNTRLTVPVAAAQSYDATYLLLYALFAVHDGKVSGEAIKRALENIPKPYYGVVATWEKPFTVDDKDAVTPSMLLLGKVQNGRVTFAYPEDAKRNLFVQHKK